MARLDRKTGSLELAKALCVSVSGDALQAAGVLAALAAVACTHPLAGLAAGAAGAGLLYARSRRPVLDALGRDEAEVARMKEGFTLRIGNESSTGRPVLLSNDDVRQHMLVLGTPSPAKTDFLLGLAQEFVMAGTGIMYVDAKGEGEVFARAYAMAKRHGRLDDLLVLNLLGAGTEAGHPASNTVNPLSTGSSDNLTQLLVGLMSDPSAYADERRGKATALLTGLMRLLVHRRNEGGLALDFGTVRDHLTLSTLVGLAEGGEGADLPDDGRAALRSYLSTLPHYNPERGARQAQATMDAHADVEMHLARALGTLADSLGDVTRASPADIDFTDVVMNRRILVVLLPPAASNPEAETYGRMVVAGLKGMMGAALGNRIEGSWEEIVDNRVTTSPSPFLCILDDVAEYAVEGLALMAAQARSLGFGMVYGGADIPTMRRSSEREVASIVANTNTKVFFRTEGGVPGHSRWLAGRDADDAIISLAQGEALVMFKSEKVFMRGVGLSPGGGGSVRINRLVALPPLDTRND